MEAALASFESLKLGELPNYSQTARIYGVDRHTLSRRHRGVQGSREQKSDTERLLTSAQESELIQYIEGLTRRGLPPSREMIRNFAGEIAGKQPGKTWTDRFVKRHQNQLVSHWATGIDIARKRADSIPKYELYFNLLGEKIRQYDVEPRDIYNMDEKGFLIGILPKMKRVFSRHLYDAGGFKQTLQCGNREWITTIACICADGSHLTPSLIYQAVGGGLQDTWLQDFDPEDHRVFFASSPSGWTNNEMGVAWLKQVFDRETKPKARRSHRLLILDGHGSHVTMEFINFCDANKILLAIYPPHSTHTLQPLDVSMFGPLSSAYGHELSAHMAACHGLSSITKRDFFRFFWAAWDRTFNETAILKAWKAVGISPLDPYKILKKFKSKAPERPSSSGSSSSVLSASDWRKIEDLLRQVVGDTLDRRTRKLTRVIQKLAAKTALTEYENRHLETSLVNEKKKRQRNKPLLLEAPKEYNGGAVFWSPSKVKDARARQSQKDALEAEIRLQKDVAIEQRKATKQAKAEMLEQRKRERLATKELKLQQQEDLAVARKEAQVARAADKQLRQDIQMSKKSRRRSYKPLAPPQDVAKETKVIVVNKEPVVDLTPASPQTTRTRKVRLPERFRI